MELAWANGEDKGQGVSIKAVDCVFVKDLFGQMPTLLLGVGVGNAHSEMQEGP